MNRPESRPRLAPYVCDLCADMKALAPRLRKRAERLAAAGSSLPASRNAADDWHRAASSLQDLADQLLRTFSPVLPDEYARPQPRASLDDNFLQVKPTDTPAVLSARQHLAAVVERRDAAMSLHEHAQVRLREQRHAHRVLSTAALAFVEADSQLAELAADAATQALYRAEKSMDEAAEELRLALGLAQQVAAEVAASEKLAEHATPEPTPEQIEAAMMAVGRRCDLSRSDLSDNPRLMKQVMEEARKIAAAQALRKAGAP